MNVKHVQQQRENLESDFPIVCAKCLGDHPYLRMIKRPMGAECKMCFRVFTVYQWKREKGTKYMKTIICHICSTIKNICQSCCLDLEFGLPHYIRNAALAQDQLSSTTQSEVTTIYQSEQAARLLEEGTHGDLLKTHTASTEAVLRMARSDPYDVGTKSRTKLRTPDDKSIKTLYVGGIDFSKIEEDDIKAHFKPYGLITSMKVIQKQNCALITFAERADAEVAAEALYNQLIVKGCPLKLMWAKPKKSTSYREEEEEKQEQKQIVQHVVEEKKSEIIENNHSIIMKGGEDPFKLAPPPGTEDQAYIYPSMKSN